MKKILLALLLVCASISGFAQTIIPPENDSTFVSEFRDGDEWAVIARNGFVVGLGNKYVKDDYGKFYQIRIMVQNLTEDSYTFNPDTIYAGITKKDGTTETLRVYSNEAFQKKIKRQQAWASALYGLSAGLNAGMAGYQTSYVTTRSYNGYTYTQPVTTYNSTAAYQANMAATAQLMVLGKQMELDKRIREEGYLKKTTIHPSEGILGYMNVKREKGKSMRVVIPINGEDYVFLWDVTKKKK